MLEMKRDYNIIVMRYLVNVIILPLKRIIALFHSHVYTFHFLAVKNRDPI